MCACSASCAVVLVMVRTHEAGSSGEVEKRKKKDPDDVDEVPVKARILQLDEVVAPDLVAFQEDQHDDHQHHANGDVKTVQSSHAVVQAEEQCLSMGPLR